MFNPRAMSLVAMIACAAAARIVPHPWNFTPIGAMCLFGGAYFQRKWAALVVPMAALLISDIVLAFTIHRGFPVTTTKYYLFAFTVLWGMTLHGRVTFARVGTAAIGASVMFFILSNLDVWLGGKMYPQTPAGLLTCYVAALPFAMNMLAGNLVYCGVMFGGWELLARRWPALGTPALARVQTD
jgi:uncharacterized protein DUF6580